MVEIVYGFAETCAKTWKLKSKYFPSKIGGKPSFLSLSGLPSANDLECTQCHQTMRFMLQVYAPLNDTDLNAFHSFHRTLFVFCCFNNACNQFKVFRSQLARINEYYSDEAPDYKCDHKQTDKTPQQFGHHLCVVCGCDATKNCSQCSAAYYCSKQHQLIDWKEGNHKSNCGKPNNDLTPMKNTFLSVIFPEYELIIGNDFGYEEDVDEDSDADDSDDSDDHKNKTEEEKKKLIEYIRKCNPKLQNEKFDESYEQTLSEDQIAFNKFKRNSGLEVIRYYSYTAEESVKELEPLWISSRNKPKLPIPNCEYCGAERRLEFQVMPQLLNKILKSEDDLDWGTLVVYTCRQSCDQNLDHIEYKCEYIWNQRLD